MNIQTLKTNLEEKFDVLGFYDLADAMFQHGSIFKIFKNHYQEVYAPNQRIVFYTSQQPSQLVLDHLQRAATKIDISNWFITVCCSYDINDQLDEANKKYGNDVYTINWYSCVLTETKIINSNNIYPFEYFCVVPFGVISIDSIGNATPCCKYKEDVGVFNNTFDFNQSMSNIRNDIKDKIPHKNCSTCWNAEHLGQTSLREHLNTKYLDICDEEWVDYPNIQDLTISTGNVCNFACRICDAYGSSKIAVEQLKFTNDIKEKQKLKKLVKLSKNNDYSIVDAITTTPNLTNIHLLGGEPLLWKSLEELIDKLVSAGLSKNIQIEFSTNGSIFPDNIIKKLLEFKSVEILLSIDDIEKRFELQRGGEWDVVLNNILKFKNLKSTSFSVKIVPTVNIQNLLYLDQLAKFCSNNDLEIVWWFLEEPAYLSIDRVTRATKDAVFKKYINHPNTHLQQIAKRMYKTDSVNGNLFLNYMNELDKRRNQDSSEILKEIFNLMSV